MLKNLVKIKAFKHIKITLKAGDERIELPPKVLETPIIPFDQSPVLRFLSTCSIIHYFYGLSIVFLIEIYGEIWGSFGKSAAESGVLLTYVIKFLP